MPAGRKPLSIAEHVDRLEGSPVAKGRLRVILANLAGQMNVAEACAELGIEASWFFELKHESLAHWLEAVEPEFAGRRPAAPMTPEQQRIAELEGQNQRLQLQLQAAQLRAELARAGLSRQQGKTDRAAKKARR
jgi:transposase-like protein